jgi:hypothetical protein
MELALHLPFPNTLKGQNWSSAATPERFNQMQLVFFWY